ncbi:hypothetical protein [Marinifilum caeruleilacunae]|uniref:Uncharacterized protein n=1 Tax=Marinifilum caeruleilacunae TaxID=2499076 RepID=A0ABX1X1I2_9BACT|nr:hypothetical protein [Marinifilum caeruleilacunae]NOU62230.1 hypothetical protein [Marinifilum caeruleilacunae]
MELAKKPLAPLMRKMKVGQVEVYPCSQNRSINVTASNLNIEEGKSFSRKRKGNVIEVTRTA